MVEFIYSEDKNVDKEFNSILCKIVGYSVVNSLWVFCLGVLLFIVGVKLLLLEVCEYEKVVYKLFVKFVVYVDFLLLVLGGKFK